MEATPSYSLFSVPDTPVNVKKILKSKELFMKPDILYEDNDIIVCYKPAKLAVQTARTGIPDMVSILKNHIYKTDPKKKPPYLAVIHRLDQPVEGILVFAKTKPAAAALTKQLTSFGFGKHYMALLSGRLANPQGTLVDYLVKDSKTNSSSVCTPATPGAKQAILHYTVAEASKDSCLVNIRLETGRHHQIRVQMAHAGCPIQGDTKYNPAASHSELYQQLALCACQLDFAHPKTNKELHFSITPAFFKHPD